MDGVKDQKEILKKLGIKGLNPMQKEAHATIRSSSEVILLSPTGTGKTLAFLLPIIEKLNPNIKNVQAMILVPSRELALQIEQVVREMGSGFKTNAVYGGRAFSQDKLDLKHPPELLIGTPGRLADHLRRGSFSTENIENLVLDEFDKSLEVGFESEMKEIIAALPNIKNRVLTSATQQIQIPGFVGLKDPVRLNFLEEATTELEVKIVRATSSEKMTTLVKLLKYLRNDPGILFCNLKDSIQEVSDFLTKKRIPHGCFYGGMEQKDRERALIKFRNGTYKLLIATDLAARGIDVPEIQYIVHFQLPLKPHEFTHRNGRTARMNRNGTAYILRANNEKTPEYVQELNPGTLTEKEIPEAPPQDAPKNTTLFISGGRRDKISKGDIAGLFFKQGKLQKDQLGLIEIKQDCAFVAIPESTVNELLPRIDNTKLKKKKVRITAI